MRRTGRRGDRWPWPRVVPRTRSCRCRGEDAGQPGDGLSDRIDHEDLHRRRRDAAVGARSGGPRRTGERLPSQLSAGSDEVGVAAADCATPPDAYSGVGYSRRLSDLLQPGVGSGVRAGRSGAPAPADYYRRGCLWRSSRGRRPSATTWCSRTNQPIRPAGNPVRNHISQSGRGLSRRRRRSRATARSNSASVSRGMKSLDADVVT
jgi:hypothetical protein